MSRELIIACAKYALFMYIYASNTLELLAILAIGWGALYALSYYLAG